MGIKIWQSFIFSRQILSPVLHTPNIFRWSQVTHKNQENKPMKRYSTSLAIQFSRSVVSNSLRPHELQHARPPCPSPTTGVHPNPCPLSRCQPNISVVPFSSCPQSFPASGSFQMSQLFASGGQSIGVSAST